MLLPRIVLAITIVLVGLTVLITARAQSERRLFFMDIERELTDADGARVLRVQVVTLLSSAFGVLVALFAADAGLLALTATLLPFVPVCWLLAEMVALVRTLPAPAPPARFTVPFRAAPGLVSYVSLPLQIANLAVLAVSSAVFWTVRAGLPERVPLHFDASGRANRWGSPDELWLMLGVMVFDYALMWLIVWGVSRERWALPTGKEERYHAAQMRRRRLIVRMVEALMFFVNASMAVLWLGIALGSRAGEQASMGGAIVVSLVLVTVGTIGSLVGFMRPIVRVQDELRSIGGSAALGTHASGWKWGGLVYYCPEDPALFVPKQRGIGQTFNFARPTAWLFLLLVLALPLVISGVGALVARR